MLVEQLRMGVAKRLAIGRGERFAVGRHHRGNQMQKGDGRRFVVTGRWPVRHVASGCVGLDAIAHLCDRRGPVVIAEVDKRHAQVRSVRPIVGWQRASFESVDKFFVGHVLSPEIIQHESCDCMPMRG